MFGNFDETFKVIEADSKELRQKCFQLYREAHRLDESYLVSAKQDSDTYEKNSIYCLLQYIPTQKYVGTVRIILGKKIENKLFPIQKAAKKYFYNNVDYHKLDRQKLAEISRIAILPEFRQKFATIGLLSAVFQVCMKHNIDYFYIAIAPRVQCTLEKIGIKFTEISQVVSYEGQRQCYLGFCEEIIESMLSDSPQIWEILTSKGSFTPQRIFYKSYHQKIEDDQMYNYS